LFLYHTAYVLISLVINPIAALSSVIEKKEKKPKGEEDPPEDEPPKGPMKKSAGDEGM